MLRHWLVLVAALQVAPPPTAPPVPATEAPTAPTAVPAVPAVPEVRPARTHYRGREIAVTMSHEAAPWLTRTTREREESSSALLEALAIEPGQVICDMGCGNGYHSLPLARRVGEKGRVLAVDIQPEMLRLLVERAAEAGLTNVEPILGTLVDPGLPDARVDLVLMVDVYHEFSHPELMLKAIRRSLKPDGRIVLVEFRAEDPEVPIKELHKMSKAQILKEIPPNGFRLDREFDDLPWQHVMFFRKDRPEQERAADTDTDRPTDDG